jgi:methylase of polypeptide subunit release factors
MYKIGEKFTAHFASALLERARFQEDLSKFEKLVVLDNACGTGIVSAKLMEMVGDQHATKVSLTCADISERLLVSVKERIERTPWPNAKTVIADAQVWFRPRRTQGSRSQTDLFNRTPSFPRPISPTSSSPLGRC